MTTPDPAAPVAATDVETQLRLLCHPNAEVLDDKDRIDRFVRWGSVAAAEIARLRAEVAELRAETSHLYGHLSEMLLWFGRYPEVRPDEWAMDRCRAAIKSAAEAVKP